MKSLLLIVLLLIPAIGNCASGGNNTYTIPAKLTTLIDYNGTSNAVYVGTAGVGAITTDSMWSIEYIQYNGSGNATSVQWSPNYKTFGDIWASRDSLSYS